jgi:hypothetical protein
MKTWTQLTPEEQREAREWWEAREEVFSRMTEREALASIFQEGEPPESPPWPSPPVDFRAIPPDQRKEHAYSSVLLPVEVSQRIDRMLEDGEPFTDEVCVEIETEAARFSGLPVAHLRWENHEVIYDLETR